MDLDRGAFDVDLRAFTIGEVLALARAGGVLDRTARRLATGIMLVAKMEERGEDVPAKTLQAAVNEWRGARHLASIDETEAWLGRNGVDLDALAEHVRRRIAADRYAAQQPNLEDRSREVSGSMLDGQLADEVLFSGELSDVIRETAFRTVAEPRGDLAGERKRLHAEVEARGGIDGIAAAFRLEPDAVRELTELEVGFRAHRALILSPAAMSAEAHRIRRKLTRIEYVTAAFDTEDAAEEALCCLRRDSKWLEPLGDATGIETTREVRFVEDLEASALSALLSGARSGESFGPDLREGRFLVYEVLGRIDPTLEDPEIRARVERQLIKRTLHPRVEDRVRFRVTE